MVEPVREYRGRSTLTSNCLNRPCESVPCRPKLIAIIVAKTRSWHCSGRRSPPSNLFTEWLEDADWIEFRIEDDKIRSQHDERRSGGNVGIEENREGRIMRGFLFAVLLSGVVGFAVVLAGAFLVHALMVMDKASSADAGTIARFGSPMGEIGIAIGLVIASLAVLLVCIRYASSLPMTKR